MLTDLESWAYLASITATLIAALGLIHTAIQVRHNTKVSNARFWLDLETEFSQHDEVHVLLRPGGAWAEGNGGPTSVEDWNKVEAYMGMFERCEILLDLGLLDWKLFESNYGYRLRNIVANERIRIKLVRAQHHSPQFKRLLQELKLDVRGIDNN